MNWLPLPQDFRASLKSIDAVVDTEQGLHGLIGLAKFRLGYLETIQLDNALRRVTASNKIHRPRLRLALLASSTVDHLIPAIRVALLRRGVLIDIYSGSFGQFRQELLDTNSKLHHFRPEYVLFSINAREAIAGVALDTTEAAAGQAIGNTINDLTRLWGIARARFGATIIQQTFLDMTEPLFGSYDRLVPGAPSSLISRANNALADAARDAGALLLDIDRASARDGIGAWFDRARWLQGKFEIAPQSAPMYGDLVARLIGAQRGISKKCLVLDLDDTLWGGVIGDDGLDGIRLGEGSAVGEAHSGLQRYAKALKERGVILAVCSKNEPATAEGAFRDHPEMVLRRSDIAAFVANWRDKAENLQAIASQLNIGLDSLVFVDDNPVERARIRESLPIVAVPELPPDPAYFVQCIADAGYFEAINFTDEDRVRTSQYVANAEREALQSVAPNMDDFLRKLDMKAVFGPIRTVDLARVAQLINKTNQFNTTTRRYSHDEVARIAADPRCVALQFRLTDRFGDNGLVSVMLLKPVESESETLEIDTWVMSCRVFGRQLELEAMNIAVECAQGRGTRAIQADFIPTKRNDVVSGLYESLGLTCLNAPLRAGEPSRWSLRVADYRVGRTFITREVQRA